MDHDTKNFKAACEALLHNDIPAARVLIAAFSTDWANIVNNTRPSANNTKVQAESTLSQSAPQKAKAHTPSELMGVFRRDGFIDRYTGAKLIIPPLLRLLSTILPDVFPYHPNWKRGACHPVYWSLSATVDHVVPLADGGPHRASNLVSTSMLTNLQKGKRSLTTLGWALVEPGRIEDWDGLSKVYAQLASQQSHGRRDPYHQKWLVATREVLRGVSPLLRTAADRGQLGIGPGTTGGQVG